MEFFMSGVACITPIMKPTPSAMIAMMAIKRPNPDVNSFAIVLVNLFILTPPVRNYFYHSMTSTSAGCALSSSPLTLPFLT